MAACIGTSSPSIYSLNMMNAKNITQQDYSPVIITEFTSSGDIIAMLFSNKTAIDWDQFKLSASYHLKAKDEDLDQLKSVLGSEQGSLDKAHFSKFLRWFSPLVPESSVNRTSSSVWKISKIANLVSQPWFHGFTMDANRRLQASAEGSFVIRFGCQAPHFVLALKDRSTQSVMEWRVLSGGGGVKLQDGERFQDLHKLVLNYSQAVPSGASCPLIL